MTREEAKKQIEVFRTCMIVDKAESHIVEALNLAVEALEQEPCTDAISRQAALDTFGLSEKSRKYGGDHSGYDTIMLYEVQDALEALPPVQPRQKTGQKARNNMADIELVIKIPEDTYNDIIKNGFMYDEDNEVVTHAIKNGTPHEAVTEFADRCRECGRERVLDKIRAEILNFKEKCNASDYLGCGILEIIDKYKAESEDKG